MLRLAYTRLYQGTITMICTLFGFRAFHHYRKERDGKEPLPKHPELERLLREEYKCLENFSNKDKAPKAAGEECSSSKSNENTKEKECCPFS
jgi:hypothetical protein